MGALMIAAAGFDPLETSLALVDGALGNPRAIGVTITNATPLILAGLGVAIPFRCGLLNIGAEGQIYIGGLMATLAALVFTGLPWGIHLPLVLLAAFLG